MEYDGTHVQESMTRNHPNDGARITLEIFRLLLCVIFSNYLIIILTGGIWPNLCNPYLQRGVLESNELME